MTATLAAPCTCATTGPTWTLLIPAPAPLWSANDSHKRGPRATSASRALWRQAAYTAAAAARLPKGLALVRLAFTFHFTDLIRRDALNYSETAKPIIDGLGPPFVQPPTAKRPRGAAAPGWGLIPDDTPEFLAPTSLWIGPLWRDVPGAAPSGFGGVTVTVTDLSGVVA